MGGTSEHIKHKPWCLASKKPPIGVSCCYIFLSTVPQLYTVSWRDTLGWGRDRKIQSSSGRMSDTGKERERQKRKTLMFIEYFQ